MSLALNLGENTTGRQPRESRNETNTGSGNLQRSLLTKPSYQKISDSDWPLLILYLTGLYSDSLFLFVGVISDDKKCIRLDERMGITACVLRTVIDFLSTILFFSFKQRKVSRKDAWKHFLISIIQVLSVLPVPQVIVAICIIPKVPSSTIFRLAIFFLVMQHLPRLLRLWTTIQKRKLVPISFAKFLALFIFIYFSQFYGALWYKGALATEVGCWKKACESDSGCSHYSFLCYRTSEDYRFLYDFCSRNSSNYDFGIYRDAHQSGILEMSGSPTKLLYIFRWSLQNLCGFGQNLELGTNVGQNILALGFILIGLLLFVVYIAMIQSFLRGLTRTKMNLREVQQWKPFKNLTDETQSKFKMYRREGVTKGVGVNIDNLLNNLPKELRKEIAHELCIELLKKVEEFRGWSETSLKEMCNYVKPVFYSERTRIIQEGDPIDEIVFVVQGTLWTYTKAVSTNIADRRHNNRNDHLKDGDFYGKELVNWVQADPYTSDLPISPKTVQTITNVEAFVLMAYDLKRIFIKRSEIEVAIHFTELPGEGLCDV